MVNSNTTLKSVLVPVWAITLATVSFIGGSGLWLFLFNMRGCL
jgi:hypothetical protein